MPKHTFKFACSVQRTARFMCLCIVRSREQKKKSNFYSFRLAHKLCTNLSLKRKRLELFTLFNEKTLIVAYRFGRSILHSINFTFNFPQFHSVSLIYNEMHVPIFHSFTDGRRVKLDDIALAHPATIRLHNHNFQR